MTEVTESVSAGVDRVVEIDEQWAEPMRELFQQVFGHPLSAAQWQWKYGEGRGHGVGVVRDGKLIAHYGGSTRPVRYFGQLRRACQACDLMVLASANSALVRRGPAWRVTSEFLGRFIGPERHYHVGYGFPNKIAYRVPERLGLYERVDEVMGLEWAAKSIDTDAGLRWEPMGQRGKGFSMLHRRAIDRQWRAMATALSGSIVGVRDASWLRYRYLMHPEVDYEVLLVRRGWLRRTVGVLVVRRHAQHLVLLDLVAAPAATSDLVAVARHLAAQAGLQRVEAWMTRSHLDYMVGQGEGAAKVHDIQVIVPGSPGASAQAVRGHWFLMAGDADST